MKGASVDFDREKVAKIGREYGLVFVVLFGSRARRERGNSESDLDIAILTEKKPDVRLFRELYSAFSDTFSGENVDIRFLHDADLLFRFQVVRDGILLAGDEEEYQAYVLQTTKRYVDDGRKYFPFMQQLALEQQKKLEEGL